MQLLGDEQTLFTFCKTRESQSCTDPSGELPPQPVAYKNIKFEHCRESEDLGCHWSEYLSPGSPEHETVAWFPFSVAVLEMWLNK